jgi:hypothetical protein
VGLILCAKGNMEQKRTDLPPIRLAELMAALSLSTDLGMGQPLEYALSVCVLSVRLGDVLGLSESELRELGVIPAHT